MTKKLVWIAAFSAAMGFLEAIVVVYLRELYYPAGFTFPLVTIPDRIFLTEILREFSTLVMLLAIGSLGGTTFFTRFTCFLYSFGVWDIFYYVALKLLLNWPDSFLTWDILFLIPVTWIGPVLAPILCALAMIVLHLLASRFQYLGYHLHYDTREWVMMIVGAILVYVSFTIDYTLLVMKFGTHEKTVGSLPRDAFVRAVSQFIPSRFAWEIFLPGFMLICGSIVCYALRRKRMIPA